MATYKEVMTSINAFLVNINKLSPLSDVLFQGVFVKELSNSNLVYAKKYTNTNTGKRTHQSHLDLTGHDTLKFFFGEHPSSDEAYSQIMLDIPVDNLKLLQQLDNSTTVKAQRGTPKKEVDLPKRNIPANFTFTHSSDLFYYAYAFKKLEGHSGDQNQINRLQNKDEFFDLCASAYEKDLLVFMKHSLNHYICILIPSEYSAELSELMGNSANFSICNPSFDTDKSSEAFCSIMKNNVTQEFDDIDISNRSVSTGLSGYDKEQFTKIRVGQSSFRKLLIEQRGCTCELCSVNVPEVLRASHIQSWATSTPTERLDLQNGLLLCANHDVLFDRHLITIDVETNKLLISSSISEDQQKELKLIHPKTIYLSERMKAYMKKHNNLFES